MNTTIIATNRKARFEYFIEKRFEAGISLQGAEVKSVRKNGISIQEAYIGDIHEELYLINAHVSKYTYSFNPNYNPTRQKKLLLNKKEIFKIKSLINQKSYTSIPLMAYFNKRGLLKITIGICKGKKLHDKRRVLKDKTLKRDERYN